MLRHLSHILGRQPSIGTQAPRQAPATSPAPATRQAAPEPDPEAGFRPAMGQHYGVFLSNLHEKLLFDWYLEIGCRTGRSFAPVRGKTIAVDPFFRVETNVIGVKPRLHILQQTSDEFFESGFLNACGIRLSFSFLDGMHLFEFLLRDFMNTEAASRAEGVIAMHDCCPFTRAMTTRDCRTLPEGTPWTGDVWKLIPILRRYRPDLTVTALDCRPTGLVLVSGLDPENQVLRERHDEILSEWMDLGIDDYGLDRFNGELDYSDARAFAAAGYPLFRGVALDEAQAKPVWVSP